MSGGGWEEGAAVVRGGGGEEVLAGVRGGGEAKWWLRGRWTGGWEGGEVA